MAIVPRLFPKVAKEKKPSYIRYIQKRNALIALVSISLFIGLCLILFSILSMVLLKKHLIHDKDGNPYKDGWFLWPIWIFYSIAMAIACSQIYNRYKEYKELKEEVFPPEELEEGKAPPTQQVPTMSTITTPTTTTTTTDSTDSITCKSATTEDGFVYNDNYLHQESSSSDNRGEEMTLNSIPMYTEAEEDYMDDELPTRRQERKQQRARLTMNNHSEVIV